jgi:hypothetical protein
VTLFDLDVTVIDPCNQAAYTDITATVEGFTVFLTHNVNEFAAGCTAVVSIYSLSENKFLDTNEYT